MKAVIYFSLMLISVMTFISCKKSDGSGGTTPANLPVLTTTEKSAITSISAKSGGVITSDGGSPITARGVCWSDINPTPTIADQKTTDGAGSGTFTSTLTGLTPYNGYDVRAYATNANGTAYGNVIHVLTAPGVTVVTGDVYVDNYIRICETQISINGFHTPNAPTVTESGVCWSKSQNPTTADTKITTGQVTEIYHHFINTGLLFGINSTYYIRGYAITNTGTTYGNQVTYTTGVDIGLGTGGGIIFDIDNTGQHGFVAATDDQGSVIPWAPGNLYNVTTNATSHTDGAGNTTKIIATYGNSGSYAAKLCRDYRGGGFTDWYLPASVQIKSLQVVQNAIGGFHGSEFLTSYYYWSSTEANNFKAWEYDFNPRYFLADYVEKYKSMYVRAVRTF
jgi:hypothetical protein